MNYFITMLNSFFANIYLFDIYVFTGVSTLKLPSLFLFPLFIWFLLCVDYRFLVSKMSPYDIQQSSQ